MGASSGALGSDIFNNMVPRLHDNIMEMKSQGSSINGAAFGEGIFDSRGSEAHAHCLREAELQHGRIAMLATLGSPVAKKSHPFRSAARTSRRSIALHAETLASDTEAVEYEVKRSRFVTHAGPATSFDEAERFLERYRDPKQRHNCWAWVGANSARMSDDGEPTGTAAAPIRAAIEGADFVDCVVVVTRYKPSTAPKLGAGGLIRAYGQAARDCLKTAVAAPAVPPKITLDFVVAPEAYGGMRGILSSWAHRGVLVVSESYRDDGAALIELTLDDVDTRAPFLREAEAAGRHCVREAIHNISLNLCRGFRRAYRLAR